MSDKSILLNKKLIQFRKNVRKNKKNIINNILRMDEANICIFCGTNQNLSKEHVIPKWLFEKKDDAFFIGTLNKAKKTYQKTTVTACKTCNSDLLGYLEDYILKNLKFPYNPDDLDVIILWLEIIDYKFIVHDFNTRFIKNYESREMIPYLRDFTLMELREDFPWRTLVKAIDRLIIKKKNKRINSFVFYNSKNPSKNILHTNNEFIFIESPKLKCAVFYFLQESFETENDSAKKAWSIIQKHYK